MKDYKIAVAGTGYVGLSIATLLSQHYRVMAVDIAPEKVEMINHRKSPILLLLLLLQMSTQQTVLMLHSRKEPVLHTIWDTEISSISQLYELKTPTTHTKRRIFNSCDTKLVQLFRKLWGNDGKQEKTTKIHEFIINV